MLFLFTCQKTSQKEHVLPTTHKKENTETRKTNDNKEISTTNKLKHKQAKQKTFIQH